MATEPIAMPTDPPAAPAAPTSLHLMVAAKLPVDPGTAVGLAQTGDPSDVLANGHAAAEFATNARFAATMQQLSDADQQVVWNHLGLNPDGVQSQAKLLAAAYQPPAALPAAAPPRGGIAGDIVHALDDVRHAAAVPLAFAGHATVKEGGSLLHDLSVPFSEVNHGYRALSMLAAEADPKEKQGLGASGFDPMGGLDAFGRVLWKAGSITNWAQAWRETTHGATTYDPQVVTTLKNQLGEGRYALLEAVSNGGNPAKLIGNYPAALQQPAKDFIQSSTFQQGLRELDSARFSPGRDLLGENALNQGGKAGELAHAAAGTADGLFDWYADPVVLGAKVKKAQDLLHYALNGNDIMTMFRSGEADVKASSMASSAGANVYRAMDDVAHTLNTGGPGALIDRWPQLTGVANELEGIRGANKVLTARHVASFFASEQGKEALAAGRAGLFYHGQTMIPHLNVLRWAAKDGKVLARSAINWAAKDSMESIVGKLAPGLGKTAARVAAAVPSSTGSLLRRVSTFLPRQAYLDLRDPASTQTFYRTALAFLPTRQARDLTTRWVTASNLRNEGRQIAVTRGLIDEIFTQSGLTETPQGSRYYQDLLNALDDSDRSKRFMSTPGADLLPNESGHGRHAAAVIEPEFSHVVALPDYKEMARLARYVGVMGETIGGAGGDYLDYAMRVWRLGILMRVGFAFRAGGEELANAFARLTPGVVLHSMAARTASGILGDSYHPLVRTFGPMAERLVESAERKAEIAAGGEARDRVWISHDPLRDITDVLTAGWSPELRKSIKTGQDFVAAVFAAPKRVVRIAGKHIAGEEWMNGWKALADNNVLDGAFADTVSSVHAQGAGWGTDVRDRTTWTKRGIATAPIEMRPGRDFKAIASDGSPIAANSGETVFHQAWAKRLNWLRQSDIGTVGLRALVENENKPWGTIVQAQRRAIFDLLKSEGMKDVISRSERSVVNRAGQRVGQGISREDALRDWAAVATDYVNELVRTPAGRLIHLDSRSAGRTLASELDRGNLTPQLLARIPKHLLPNSVVGGDTIPFAQNALDRILSGGMQMFVAKPMDWLSRQPIFGANYVLARRETTQLFAHRFPDLTAQQIEKLVHDVSLQRAISESLPYIHDVRSRTMFEHASRHFAPFMFAQRQFYTRWAKVVVHSPQAFRRAQQVMNGLRVSGFVRSDPSNGQDYFVYPGSSALINSVSKLLTALHVENYVPVPNSFTGEIRYLTPGLTGVTPDVGPAIVMPLETLLTFAPALTPTLGGFANIATQGNVRTGTGILTGEAPTLVQRLLQVHAESATGQGEVATAILQAANYLVATHQIDLETMTDSQRSQLYSRLKSWTVHLLILRAAFGFAAPSSPTLNFDGLQLDSKLQRLFATEPYDQALADFIRLYPDGVPYTVGKTQTQGGAHLPTTNAGLNYLNAHRAFLLAHPAAGPWLIPASVGTGPYSQAAENEQLQTGLRTDRNFNQWVGAILDATDGTVYYDSKQAYEKALDSPTANTSAIQQAWVKWQNAFFKTHPQFGQLVGHGFPNTTTPDERRAAVISDMTATLASPALPKSSTTEAIRGLMKGWDAYTNGNGTAPGVNDLKGVSSKKGQLWNLTNAFTNWATEYVAEHPEAKAYWAGVLQYAVSW